MDSKKNISNVMEKETEGEDQSRTTIPGMTESMNKVQDLQRRRIINEFT